MSEEEKKEIDDKKDDTSKVSSVEVEKEEIPTLEKGEDFVENNAQEKDETQIVKNTHQTVKTESELIERVIKINRVSKVVKGGKNFSFSAMVVIGDANGNVGIGFGKSNEVVEAIKKGTSQAKKSFVKIEMKGDSIPHEIIGEFKASRVILKPAGPGTGVIAGGPVRAMCDAVGIKKYSDKKFRFQEFT